MKPIKTYVLSMARATQRREYIIKHCQERNLEHVLIEAVDGQLLTAAQIEETCDMAVLKRLRHWLTNGAIGCAITHLRAYEAFIASGEEFAFFIEDDAVLPANIQDMLNEIAGKASSSEVVLLYYTSFRPAQLSRVNRIELSGSMLCHPMDISQPITATAYLLSRQAAINLSNAIIPIQVTADSWAHYYNKGCFTNFRVQYPMSVSTKNFKSSIGYLREGSLSNKVSAVIDKHRLPVAYQFATLRRALMVRKKLNHFKLVNEKSPCDHT